MDLSFSLKEMKEVLRISQAQVDLYNESIQNLDIAIKQLENYWISTETGTYEEFKNHYLEKKSKIFEAKDYMIKFCQKLEEQIFIYEDASKDIKNLYE